MQATDTVERTTEEGYVDVLRSSCRRLCSLLQALAHPTKNTITYTVDHTPYLPALACGVLRQFYHKAVALWETIFEHLRLWAFGLRNKIGFPHQKKAVAILLAQVCTTVETYSNAYREVANLAFAMLNLASDPRLLISQLEFLGKGIDMRNFNTARQDRQANVTTINISTVDANRALASKVITKYTFTDILHHKPDPYLTSHNSSANHPSDHFPSFLSIGPSPSAHIVVESPVTSNRPALGLFSGFGESSPDSVDERAVRLQTEAKILEMQAYLEEEKRHLHEQEQKVRQIEEEIFNLQILLGPAKPPAHLDVENFFDEMPTYSVGENQNSGSPGEMTLVEFEPDSNFESQPPATPPKPRFSGSSDRPSNHGHSNPEDTMMEDPMPEHIIRSDTPIYAGDKKRKRFSFLSAAKKARTSEHASYHDMQTNHNPLIPRSDASRSTKNIGNASSSYVLDTDKPTNTTRPISWPRSRLFRRSAGVSVKKITEVFEGLRLQHDKPLPPIP
ncbi:MAG: hypothetical protein Q9226_003181 [Calogaya cf. arnoldii]